LVVQLTLQQVVEVVVQEQQLQINIQELLQQDNLVDQVVVDQMQLQKLEDLELHVKEMLVVLDYLVLVLVVAVEPELQEARRLLVQ